MDYLFGWADAVALTAGSQELKWSDLLGNILALATVVLALRRSIWTWPVQITGCVLLFGASVSVGLGGNAARQVVLAMAALYGWWAWSNRAKASKDTTVPVRYATAKERLALIGVLAVGTLIFAAVLNAFDASWNPLPDAYIFVGSLVATVAQGRRLIEFWYVWIAVDVVGVPLAYQAGLVASATVYGIFFVLCVMGLRSWMREAKTDAPLAPALQTTP